MALSVSTFSNLGGAVSDLFAGLGAGAKGKLSADALRINAQSTRIGASSTRLTAESLRTKARGDIAEADNYDLATDLARQNEAYTAQSTRLQQNQLDRSLTQTIGGIHASVAGAGFAEGGSGGDILRDSASQGAIAHGVLGQQGSIAMAGYEEQAKSFETMSKAGRAAAAAEFGIADKTDVIAGQQDTIAAQQDRLAVDTQKVADDSAKGSFFSAAIKGATAVASLLAAPATGGASLALGAAATSAMGDASGSGGLY